MSGSDQQSYFAAIAEATPAIIYFMDVVDQKYLYMNSAVHRILGYSPEEVLNVGPQFIISRMHPDDLVRVMQKHNERLALLNQATAEVQDSYTHVDEYRLRHLNGEWRWFRSSAVVFEKNAQGQVISILGVAQDITETKDMESQLRLSERMASVGRLAAGVAHEINNPLAHLVTKLELALERSDSMNSEIAQSLRDACDSANRIAQIVRDMKAFSRSDDVALGPVELHHTLDSSLALAMNGIRHHARLHKEYGQVPLVHANEGRLAQAFLNLLVNAVEAIPQGAAEQHGIVVRTLTDSLGCAVVEISDTGQGIAPEDLKKIFDPFYTSKPIGAGTGLGLTITYGIIKSFDGKIEVESKVGGGSCFRIILNPSHDKLLAEAAPTKSSGAGQLRGNILIIDDDLLVAESLTEVFQRQHDVKVVHSGRVGLELLRTAGEAFDVILCDLMMPNLNGMDLYEMLGEAAPQLQEKIVFITGGAFSQKTQLFLKGVSNQVVEKPYRLNSFRALVQTLVENNRAKKIT